MEKLELFKQKVIKGEKTYINYYLVCGDLHIQIKPFATDDYHKTQANVILNMLAYKMDDKEIKN